MNYVLIAAAIGLLYLAFLKVKGLFLNSKRQEENQKLEELKNDATKKETDSNVAYDDLVNRVRQYKNEHGDS